MNQHTLSSPRTDLTIPPPRAAEQLSAVQVLRGVAALLVVFRHAWNSEPTFGIGVDIFFVISGFIMVYSSTSLYGSAAGSVEFIKRRLFRVAPAYWLAMILYALVCGAGLSSYFFRSAAFMPMSSTSPFLPTGWTLNYEMYFYVIFALCLSAGSRLGPWLAATVMFCPIVAAPFTNLSLVQFYGKPFVLDFIYGIGIGIAYRHRPCLSMRQAWSLVVFGIAFLAIGSLLVGKDATLSGFRPLIWGVPAAAWVCAAVFGPPAMFTLNRAALYLGAMSYSLYLVHFSFTVIVPHQPIAMIVLSLLASAGFYTIVERPLHDLARRRADRWTGARAKPN